jgi:hypothetical protein
MAGMRLLDRGAFRRNQTPVRGDTMAIWIESKALGTTAQIPWKQRGEINNQPNDGAAWRLGATMVNGNGQRQRHGLHLTMVDCNSKKG